VAAAIAATMFVLAISDMSADIMSAVAALIAPS
jgi:hypothetical protein